MNKFFAFLAALMLFNYGKAQDDSTSKNDLVSQIKEIKESSNNYQDYKVIKTYKVDQFINALADSLRSKEARFTSLEAEIKELKSTLQLQQVNLDSTDAALAEVTSEKNEMHFIGVPMNKNNYRITMWSIIAILILVTLWLVNRFKQRHSVATEAKGNYEELEQEYTEYKKRSLEREQKLRREIIDLERKNQL